MKLFKNSLTAVLFILATAPVMADNMRCGNSLISRGDSQLKVLNYCGNPMYTEKDRSGSFKWIYYTQRGAFAKVVYIQNNRVVTIKSGERLP